MKVAILENQIPNHYLAVNSIAKIHLAKGDEVIVVVREEVRTSLSSLLSVDDVNYQVTKGNESYKNILQLPALKGVERIYIVSFYNNVEEYIITDFPCPVYVGYHVINGRIVENGLSAIFYKMGIAYDRHFFYHLRQLPKKFLNRLAELQNHKKALEKTLSSSHNKLMAYGQIVSDEIKKALPQHKDRVTYVPFCIYEGVEIQNISNKKLRICIPGTLESSRRDNIGLLKLLIQNSEEFKDKITIDFLGYLPKTETYLKSLLQKAESVGLDVIYSEKFIEDIDFQKSMLLADIVLGNFFKNSDYEKKYTETGVAFNMIRFAKPGILPSYIPIPENIRSSVIFYDDSPAVLTILTDLINNRDKISALQKQAYYNSQHYLPNNLTWLLV
jgi:hypothetical protein